MLMFSSISPHELTRNLAWLRSKGVDITPAQARMMARCLALNIPMPDSLMALAERALKVVERHPREFKKVTGTR